MISPPPNPPITNIDFATEVKSDRLSVMWKVTVVGCFVAIFGYLSLYSFVEDLSPMVWVVPPLVLVFTCTLVRHFLRRGKYPEAAGLYAVGGLIAVGCALLDAHPMTAQIAPFAFVVVVFIVGLLLRPMDTLLIACIAAIMAVCIPLVVNGYPPTGYQVFAVTLMFLGALLAAQVTGEMYAVTEWALLNYQRERRTNLDLFDSRTELQRTLKRSEALSEKLKETNTELEKAHEAAESAKNFRGQFLANMSHELRTPLNAIIGFSETMLKFPMMYDNVPLPATYQADMNQIYNSGLQLLDLINDILDLAKVDAGKLEIYMQRVDPTIIIQPVLSVAQGLLGQKPVKLICDLPDPMPLAWADETRLRQVLLNLYSNACKFTESGSITLTVRETTDSVQFSVQDTGIGIAPDQLEVIFEEFRQAEDKGRDPRAGSGLGLTITRQLLTLMGGRVWVESTPGTGSTFHFVVQPYHKTKQDTVESATILITPDAQPAASSVGGKG